MTLVTLVTPTQLVSQVSQVSQLALKGLVSQVSQLALETLIFANKCQRQNLSEIDFHVPLEEREINKNSVFCFLLRTRKMHMRRAKITTNVLLRNCVRIRQGRKSLESTYDRIRNTSIIQSIFDTRILYFRCYLRSIMTEKFILWEKKWWAPNFFPKKWGHPLMTKFVRGAMGSPVFFRKNKLFVDA